MASMNWRRGAIRLWMVGSMLWCVTVIAAGMSGKNIDWSFRPQPRIIHVHISNRETWDYPGSWNSDQIESDLKRRLAIEDKKERASLAAITSQRQAECNKIIFESELNSKMNILINSNFSASRLRLLELVEETGVPSDCATLLLVTQSLGVIPHDWESQIILAPMRPWPVIAPMLPLAIGVPLAALILGNLLFWGFSGFRKIDH